jgi:hypothetical protein
VADWMGLLLERLVVELVMNEPGRGALLQTKTSAVALASPGAEGTV